MFLIFNEFSVYTKERLYYRRELHLRLDLLAMYTSPQVPKCQLSSLELLKEPKGMIDEKKCSEMS